MQTYSCALYYKIYVKKIVKNKTLFPLYEKRCLLSNELFERNFFNIFFPLSMISALLRLTQGKEKEYFKKED